MNKEQLDNMSEKEALEVTANMDEHPKDYQGPCMCELCRRYDCDPGDCG